MARTTLHRAVILRVMLEAPFADWYGLELSRVAGFKTGTIYPALAALEQSGLMHSRWEDVDPASEGRPRRRLYRLVPERIQDARLYIESFASILAPVSAQKGAITIVPRGQPA